MNENSSHSISAGDEKMPFEKLVSSTGYKFAAETSRYQFPDVSAGDVTLNRGLCRAGVVPEMIPSWAEESRSEVFKSCFPTTLRRKSPTVDITRPAVGHYFSAHNGICFDAYLGVGQKLLDENHPRLREMVIRLMGYHGLLRREIPTNDFVVSNPQSGVKTPQQVAQLATNLASSAFPQQAPFRAYLSGSGAEAVEAGMKIACREAHARLIRTYGYDVEAKLMQDLGIPVNNEFDHPHDKDLLYVDYPFFFVTARDAFHGRTLGALSLTNVRAVHKRGFPALSRVRRIDFNGDPDSLSYLLDERSLPELLSAPGGVEGVLSEGRIPSDLVAGFVIEVFQGEGGYRLAKTEWIQSVANTCRRNQISIIADEIQTFARTGKVLHPSILA
ncbi:MAG: aminotransferase class III-fold pyridoxal phosphate-dependent enzyme [Candidatus Zixiibacteriota bacterium]